MVINDELERMCTKVVTVCLKYYASICLEETRKTTKNFIQNSWSMDQDFISEACIYEAETITNTL